MSNRRKLSRRDKRIFELEAERDALRLKVISLQKDIYNKELSAKATIKELEALLLAYEPSLLKEQAH